MSMMKKILFVVPSLEVGGTISSLLSIVEYLRDKYIVNIFVLAHEGNKNLPFNDLILNKHFAVHAYNSTLAKSTGFERILIAFIKVIKRICLIFNYDLEMCLYKSVVSRMQNLEYDYVVGYQEGAATKFASLFKNNTRFAWVHCDYSKYPMAGKEINLYKEFNRIICVSEYTANNFRLIYPALSDNVEAIHNILNINFIRDKANEQICDSYFDNSYFTIISVGRINPVKRFNLIPLIAKRLKDNGCDFRWYILGPNYNDNCYRNLINLINSYEVSENVIYLGNKENPFPYYVKSNLLISLSSTEACPMIFNEAKVISLPVLTANFGSSYEFIEDGINGRIVAIDDMFDTLYELISNKESYVSLKDNTLHCSYNNRMIYDSLDNLFA